jgi:hypothetical protein
MHHRYSSSQHNPVQSPPLRGRRRLVYACGRLLQGVGLLLIWWVLLLFAGTASMDVLLYWSLVAIGVFGSGWVCIVWVKSRG